MIRLKIMQGKTARYSPFQFVEMPRLNGWLCPVIAYVKWVKAMRGKPPGGKPMITRKETGEIYTNRELNSLLNYKLLL